MSFSFQLIAIISHFSNKPAPFLYCTRLISIESQPKKIVVVVVVVIVVVVVHVVVDPRNLPLKFG